VHDRSELWAYLCAADFYALPSRHEGFAVAPLEAMACGLPVVAADVSGVADLFPGGEADGGLIVPREDPGSLAAALLRLLDDDGLARKLGARARRRAEREYSLEVVGSHLRGFIFPDRVSRDPS
jgi:glycosyltransferase involved in cell wall biosynthesis